jgi:hypothetical protein
MLAPKVPHATVEDEHVAGDSTATGGRAETASLRGDGRKP